MKLNELVVQRAAAVTNAQALADNDNTPQEDFDTAIAAIDAIDAQIARHNALKERAATQAAETAKPVEGQETATRTVAARVETDAYASDEAARALSRSQGVLEGGSRSLVVGGMIRTLAASGGNAYVARQVAQDQYGESHPVTRALNVSTATAGGFIVPPDYHAEIIELLRAQAVIRAAGPRIMPMPRGTMTLPGQASAASAAYGSESQAISVSQPGLNQQVLSFKKLRAMVPVSNDMLRYSNPAVDAFARDDLVKVIALKQDQAAFFGDGTADTPQGLLTFANKWVAHGGGTVGVFSTTGNSTLAVNGTDPASNTGGNFVTANQTFTVDTVAQELGLAKNRLDTANVTSMRRVWFMSPRSENYLLTARNDLALYMWRDEMSSGKLLGYPYFVTNQIGNNYYDSDGSPTDLSFVFLVEMPEFIIADSMQLELAVSNEASYVDASGATVSAFQSDQTLIRAITEHDFGMRHDASVAVIQTVRWNPA